MPVAALTGHLRLGLLYPLAFLAAALAVLAEVGHLAYLPTLVGRERLVAGNSGLALGQQAARVAGPSLAGALVQAAAAPLALLVDVASFVASAVLLGTIRTREPARAAEPEGLRALWRGLGEGVRFVVADPVLRPLTGVWGLYYFAFWLFWGQYALYATRELGLTPAVFGLAVSLVAVGGVLGALATPPVTARFGAGRTLVGSVLVGALGVLLVPVAGGPPAAAAAVLVVGHGLVRLTDQLYYVNYASAIQARAPDRLRGRVSAAVRVLTAGVAVPGGAPGGPRRGGRAAGDGGGGGLGVVGAFLWLALSPVRSLRSLAGEFEAPPPAAPPPGESPGEPAAGASPPRQPITGRV